MQYLIPILLLAVAVLIREAVSDWEARQAPRQIPATIYDYKAERPNPLAARGGRYH